MTAPRLSGYGLGDVIGRDEFGVVYVATRDADGGEVAIRVDDRAIPDRGRFLDEARAVRALSAHPHVVEVLDAGVLPDARPYQVMELCEDRSLARRAPLPPAEVAETGQRIADALVAAHDLGLTHGAIDTDKLLVKPLGTVGLTGFGLAEVIESPSRDVPALTAALYALVAGHPPADPVEDVPGVSAEFMAILRRDHSDAAALRADLSQLTVTTAPRRSTSTPVNIADDDDDHDPGPARPEDPSAEDEPGRGGAFVAIVLVTVLVVVVLGWLLLAD